jgi:hypothetical protein
MLWKLQEAHFAKNIPLKNNFKHMENDIISKKLQ